MTPRILRSTAILALLFGLPLLSHASTAPDAPAKPAPKAVFPEMTWDAGRVIKGDVIRHAYEVKNEGDAPLQVLEVVPSCGCTVAEFDREIAPGASGKINVVVDTSTFDGPSTRWIGVLTNDPSNPRVQLAIKSETFPYLRARPGYARYIYVQHEPVGTITQTLWAADGFADLQVTRVESPYPYLEVSFAEAKPEERNPDGEGRQWRVSSTLRADAPVGALTDYVKIYTNHPQQRLITIPVSGFVRPVFAPTPNKVDVGTRSLTEAYRTSLVIANFATETIEITRAEVDIPGVLAELQAVTPGRRYNVHLTFQPAVAKGPLDGKLRLTTASPKQPEIVVPITGNIE
jgi:hypothetical protein